MLSSPISSFGGVNVGEKSHSLGSLPSLRKFRASSLSSLSSMLSSCAIHSRESTDDLSPYTEDLLESVDPLSSRR